MVRKTYMPLFSPAGDIVEVEAETDTESAARRSYATASGITMRRIAWHEFYHWRPDLRPSNDNVQRGKAA